MGDLISRGRVVKGIGTPVADPTGTCLSPFRVTDGDGTYRPARRRSPRRVADLP